MSYVHYLIDFLFDFFFFSRRQCIFSPRTDTLRCFPFPRYSPSSRPFFVASQLEGLELPSSDVDVVVCGINGFKYSYGGSRAGYSSMQTVANLQKLANVLQEQSWVRGMKVWDRAVFRVSGVASAFLIGRLFLVVPPPLIFDWIGWMLAVGCYVRDV